MKSQRWIIRMPGGRLSPPSTSAEVLLMIEEGRLTGDEAITAHPGERWQKVAEIPEFYQKIVNELEGPKPSTKPRPASKKEKTKLTKRSKKKSTGEPEENTGITEIIEPPSLRVDQLKQPKQKHKNLDYYAKATPAKSSVVINVQNTEEIEKEAVIKKVLPFAIFFIIGALLLWNLMDNSVDTSTQDRIHLARPKGKSGSPDAEDVQKKKTALALGNIEKDTFKNWLEAQTILTSLIESNPQNLSYRGLLCYVYIELWEYSYKDSEDIKTVELLAQGTRSLNVTSPEGFYCEAARLYLGGRNAEAKVTLESLLNSTNQFSILPIVYYLRGLLLVSESDYLQGKAFLEKAQEIWPRWTRPSVILGKVHTYKKELNEAASTYQKILEKNKGHYEAILSLGILQYRDFKQLTAGQNLIQAALKMSNRAPRALTAEAYGIMAEMHSEKGDISQAKSFAEKALQLNPSSKELKQLVLRLGGSDKVSSQLNQNEDLIIRADQYARSGDCLSAQAEYKAAFEANPKFGTAAMKAAQCLWQLYQSYEAIEWLKKATKAEPKLVQAYVIQADYLSQRFDFTGANQILNNASKIAPNSHEVMRGYAQVELRKNNFQGATNFGLRAMKAFDADPDTYVILSKAYRNQALTMVPVTKSDMQKKEQFLRDSLRYATKAVELDSTNTEAQINYGQTMASGSGIDVGISYFKDLIGKYPVTTAYRLALADLYSSEDRFSQAKELYEQITIADPKNKRAFLGLGTSLKALGFNDQALKAFLSAAVIDPTDAEATYQAAQIYFETARPTEALNNFLRVRRVNPMYPRSNLAIAKAYAELQNWDQALVAAQEEKKLNPRVAETYITIAEIYSARKQYQDCSAEYANALKIRSQDATIYVKASVCYRMSGSLDVAQDMLDLARSLESGYPDIYKEQGALFKIRGDGAAAVKSYRMYLELSPNSNDRRSVEDMIRQLGG
ncbi:MAG: tetratricopeptide repeat protein [Bdellovibrionota bacterium]